MLGAIFALMRIRPNVAPHIIKTTNQTRITSIPHQRSLPWKHVVRAGLVATLLSFTTSLCSAQQAGEWNRKNNMPTARWLLSTAVANGKIYAIGGLGPARFNPTTLPTLEEYIPAADKWSEKANLPTPSRSLSASSVGGKIYAIGGWGGRDLGILGTVAEYNPVSDTWTQKADMLTSRQGFSSSVVNGKIYAIGGISHPKVFSTVEMYDPETDEWTKKADMPTARFGLSAISVNGKIYAIGGSNSDGDLSIVEMYDPTADIWVRKAEMPTPRSNFTACVVNGEIYVPGGTVIIEPRQPGIWETVSKVEVYLPANEKWIKGIDLPAPRGYVVGGAVNGKIYVIGGTSVRPALPLQTVEEFDTGLAVNPAGKLSILWGQIKSMR